MATERNEDALLSVREEFSAGSNLSRELRMAQEILALRAVVDAAVARRIAKDAAVKAWLPKVTYDEFVAADAALHEADAAFDAAVAAYRARTEAKTDGQ